MRQSAVVLWIILLGVPFLSVALGSDEDWQMGVKMLFVTALIW